MLSVEEYYKPTDPAIFADVKRYAIEIWESYGLGQDGYAEGKIERIKDIENVSDNTCYMVAMFDQHNQGKMFTKAILEGHVTTTEWLKRLLSPFEE